MWGCDILGLDDLDDDDDFDVDYDINWFIKDLIMMLFLGSDEECLVCFDFLVELVIMCCVYVFC